MVGVLLMVGQRCRAGCSPSGYCWFIFSHCKKGGGRIWFNLSIIQCVTSKWVYVVGTIDGGENSHLSLRNYMGGWCFTGRVFSPSSKSSSDISSEGSTGRKGSLSLKLFILLISLSSSNKSCEQSILQTFHQC